MRVIIVLIVLLLTGCFVEKEPDTAKRLEQRDSEMMRQYNDGLTNSLLGEDWIKEERIKNIKADIEWLIEIVKDIDRVYITRTLDTDEYVIRIVNSEGEEAALWLTGDKVRSITPY